MPALAVALALLVLFPAAAAGPKVPTRGITYPDVILGQWPATHGEGIRIAGPQARGVSSAP